MSDVQDLASRALLPGLTDTLPGLNLTLVFTFTALLLTGYWWGRVWQEARLGERPRLAWWAVPGLGALLLAQLLDVPALFGVGAALLLLAEFSPAAFVPVRAPAGRVGPGWRALDWRTLGWAVVGLVTGLTLAGTGEQGGPLAVLAGALLVVAGVGAALAATARPRGAPRGARRNPRPGSRVPVLRSLSFATRWATPLSPALPELSVTLTGNGAQLRNVSDRKLLLAGWSPAGVNAWMRPRGPDGALLDVLLAGQTVFVPLSDRDGGVRVWYRPDSPDAPPHVFRADWTPARGADGERVLN